MQAIKNLAGKELALLAAAIALFAGCAPPGPRELLQGKKLLDKGKYADAVGKLKTAATLLRTNAVAWNYLGLACHQAGQPVEAERAYRQALTQNPDLAEAHYNLGCLWLAQGKLDPAKAELTAYTLRRGNEPGGFIKLATAQLRGREWTAAERSFNDALRLNDKNVEALTGVGVTLIQRGRVGDGAAFFNNALKLQSNYGPALLDLAIVQQQYLNNRQGALQNYREYLALKPLPDNADAVRAAARQLEQELAPPPPAPAPALAAATAIASAKPAPSPAKPAAAEPAKPPAAARPAVTNAARPATTARPEPAPVTPKPAPAAAPARAPTANVEVVKLAAEPVLRPAQDAVVQPASGQPPSAEAASPAPSAPTVFATPKSAEQGFLRRINPLGLFGGTEKTPLRPTPLPPQSGSGETQPAAAPGVETAVPAARYAYKSFAKPSPGNASEAERAIAQGRQAQQAQRLPEAIQAYRRAVQLDPASYNGWFYLGLTCSETGNMSAALAAYEHALAAKPDSVDARYNFALLLKRANYVADAVNELEKILAGYPGDSRAHLALGNIYAQQLRQPAKARPHYLKVLENDPRNPQAGAIRYWLADHPK
jgi:Flp pilus assembly protein TadD